MKSSKERFYLKLHAAMQVKYEKQLNLNSIEQYSLQYFVTRTSAHDITVLAHMSPQLLQQLDHAMIILCKQTQ